jgi:hypothetical protein
MTYYDLLKQYVSTGLALTEYQFDKIKNDGQFLNYYFYNRNKDIDYNRPTEYEVAFVDKNPKYFNKFDLNNLLYFLEFSEYRDVLSGKIIKGIGNKLDSHDIYMLLKHSDNKLLTAEKIIMIKGHSLDSDDIDTLVDYSGNRYEVFNMISDTLKS